MNSALGVRRLALIPVAMLFVAFTGCVSCTQPSLPGITISSSDGCGCGGGVGGCGLLSRGAARLKSLGRSGCGCDECGGASLGGDFGGGLCGSGGVLGGMGCGCGPVGGLIGGGGQLKADIAQKFGTMCEGGACNRPPPPGMGPGGMPGAQVRYPYYTLRGPRDFLMANPPSIGP